jgi:hypothetical protein
VVPRSEQLLSLIAERVAKSTSPAGRQTNHLSLHYNRIVRLTAASQGRTSREDGAHARPLPMELARR